LRINLLYHTNLLLCDWLFISTNRLINSRKYLSPSVWAIGTGKVATPEVAESVHATIRGILTEMYDEETADATRILYGGSVTPDSVDDLMSQPDIDGALVGGASLDASKFSRIINFEA